MPRRHPNGGQRAGLPLPERAVTASTGVILSIATVVLLSATVGVMAFQLDLLVPAAPQAGFAFAFSGDGNADVLVVEHEVGDPVAGARLALVVSGARPATADGRYPWSGPALGGTAEVGHGSSVRLEAATIGQGATLDLDAARVTLVWQLPDADEGHRLETWTGPERGGTQPPSTPAPSPTPPTTPPPPPSPGPP